jgi:F-type H+-transporting ATPase subunit epsilon
MADTMTFEMVTPLGIHKGENVLSVVLPAASGEMEVMPGHDVMIVALGIGAVTVNYEGKSQVFLSARGYVEIDDNLVRIIAEICEEKDEIDLDRAQKALDRSNERLKEISEGVDWERAMRSHKRSEERVRIASGAE